VILRRLLNSPTAAGGGIGVPDTLSWRDVFLRSGSHAGKTVTPETSMAVPAVWGAMRILTDSIGSMPLITYERTAGNGRAEAFSNPTYRLLRQRPNPEMTGTLVWRLVMFHLNAWGNSYLSKRFDSSGKLVELWPIEPNRVRVQRRGGVKQFIVADTFWNWNYDKPYTSSEILHIQGISFDGLVGLSPIEAARQAIGLGLALDEYTSSFFARGAVPSVVLQKKDGKLDAGVADRLAKDWKRKYGGLRNAHATAVLEEGLEAKVLSFPMRDLQFVEQMQWTVGDVARVFNLPASKLKVAVGDSMTYKTAETETLDLLNCVQGWLTLIEESLSGDPDVCPVKPNRPGMFAEFKADAILRVDAKTRAEYYSRATAGKPWMRGSEVRGPEGLSPDATVDELAAIPPSPIP